MIESSINTLQAHTINEVNSLKAQMSTVPNIAGAGQREEYSKLKPITEYKAINELASLWKDKTMYRDWNIKLKDALEQIYKNNEFMDGIFLCAVHYLFRLASPFITMLASSM